MYGDISVNKVQLSLILPQDQLEKRCDPPWWNGWDSAFHLAPPKIRDRE